MGKDVLTISVQRAGELLGLSRNSAYAAAKNGQLPVLKIGKRYLVPLRALEAMLESAGKPKTG